MNEATEPKGYGLSLRETHIDEILSNPALAHRIEWLEVIGDNFLGPRDERHEKLKELKQSYPMAFHFVGMNLGSENGLDEDYLQLVRSLVNEFDPAWVSDHLCWSVNPPVYHHDLLPFPLSRKMVGQVEENIHLVQNFVEKPLLVENITKYIDFDFKSQHLTEPEFIAEVATHTDCYLLLDLNNVYVNSQNHNFDESEWLKSFPKERIKQIHLAGFDTTEEGLIDTHGAAISKEVLSLYRESVEQIGQPPVCIERDQNIPPLKEMLEELETVRLIGEGAHVS